MLIDPCLMCFVCLMHCFFGLIKTAYPKRNIKLPTTKYYKVTKR